MSAVSSEEDATKIDPVLKVSLEAITTRELYTYFDKKLGIVRKIRDRFADLIERLRRAVLDTSQ